MDVSYRWLCRHVDLAGIAPSEVARELTLRTAEVEGLRPFAPVLGLVVVGHVTLREGHPNADRLSLCTVDVGADEPLSIVCGAPNVDTGHRVAVARVGTVLSDELKIKKSKIRGVESEGMICSERELGLGDEHSGIWILPEDAPIGRPVHEVFGTIEDQGVHAIDWILEIDNKSLTHRPDLWGHRGLAQEIGAILGLDLLPLSSDPPAHGDGAPYPVRVATSGCPRYVALPIDGVKAEQSPEWMRLLLLAAGQRPIDLLVDVSNFVMLDLGQPSHLFDRARLSPEGIVVREARAGETMTTLDGFERKLTTADMLICSGDEPMAIAGVMGGEGSKVAPGTRQLLLEVANFHPATVRRSAARLGLRTESSARFEKALDPHLPMIAATQLVKLLQEMQPDLSLPAPPTDAGEWSDPSLEIELRLGRARALLGVDLAAADVEATLLRLGFGVSQEPNDTLLVTVPSYRATKDVTIEEDLIEEIGRMHRYDRIPERSLQAEVRPVPRDARRQLVRRIQDRLSGGARYHEVFTYSFSDGELLEKLSIAGEPRVELVNPVSEHLPAMRRAVLPSLLSLLAGNLRHRPLVQLFEIGKGYLPEDRNDRGEPREIHELALVRAAPAPAKKARFDATSYAALQGALEDVVRDATGAALTWRAAAEGEVPPYAHARRCAVGCATGEGSGTTAPLVLLAELEPAVSRRLSVQGDVAIASVSIDRLLELPPWGSSYRALPRFPGVKVDVALAVPEDTPQVGVAEAVRAAGKGLVEDLELFDLYRGENLGEGRKSLAYHLVLRSDERTLTDKDGQRFLDRLERRVADLGGELRRE